jgi:methylamine dehydrogenase accessory protein MauD
MSGWWLVSYVVLWALVAFLTLVVVALARQVGTLHLRLGPRGALEVDDEGPPLGEAPEGVRAVDLDGREASVGGTGEPQLLVFVSPGCPVCRDILPSIPAAARAGRLSPYVIADSGPEETVRYYRHEPARARVLAAPGIARDYRVPGTPYAVVLDVMGVVRAKGTVNTLEQLEGLIDTAHRRAQPDLRGVS